MRRREEKRKEKKRKEKKREEKRREEEGREEEEIYGNMWEGGRGVGKEVGR